ncbi:hypothetical protein BS50DRAFT_484432 [Corynespora cassiicola Philippines]|uniref:Uncharacterized protein n=1 Tax=Corynespora cassiicola Philippines TaxID=1448308 RepID=A0A2T2P291_CORCC|nr:hypothetical protein BS50DRAFT_484432 [Corynespora cassiicola Philippines]
MYCRGGADPTKDEPNTNLAVNPLYQLSKEDWWFQHHRGCDAAPPSEGEYLELPANGEFTVELAHNRAHTTLSYDGKFVTDWPDGEQHPDDWNGWGGEGTDAVCLKDGALHTWNESSAAGTAFAISYQSELKDVTMENLVVFTTKYHTPWKRLTTYQVPDLPACPEGGCHCAWLWVPTGCGEGNMYMQGFKCNVTNATSTRTLAPAQAPAYCEDDPTKCVTGAKQMIAWHQSTGNNIETDPGMTPNYNQKCGWAEGAQTDIFEGGEDSLGGETGSATHATPSTSSSTSAVSAESTGIALIKAQVSGYPVSASVSMSPVPSKPCTRRQPRASARAVVQRRA